MDSETWTRESCKKKKKQTFDDWNPWQMTTVSVEPVSCKIPTSFSPWLFSISTLRCWISAINPIEKQSLFDQSETDSESNIESRWWYKFNTIELREFLGTIEKNLTHQNRSPNHKALLFETKSQMIANGLSVRINGHGLRKEMEIPELSIRSWLDWLRRVSDIVARRRNREAAFAGVRTIRSRTANATLSILFFYRLACKYSITQMNKIFTKKVQIFFHFYYFTPLVCKLIICLCHMYFNSVCFNHKLKGLIEENSFNT